MTVATEKSFNMEKNIKRDTVREMIKDLKWSDVKRAIKYFYPKDKNNYEPVFYFLQKVRKNKQKYEGEEIELEAHYDIFGEQGDAYYSIATNQYSMSLRKWSELASIKISEATLSHYVPKDIVAHFIWEITFYGNQNDIVKLKKEMDETVKKIHKEHGV